jgi:dihydroxyacetone kinase-like protein
MIIASVLGAQTIIDWLSEAEVQVKVNADYLTQLDAAIGDGDHGVNMRRGFDAVGRLLASEGNGAAPGRLLSAAGKTLVNTVGGASGPLWGVALRRAGRSLGNGAEFDANALADALDAAIAGVVELGAAQIGDKTMVDSLVPGATAFRQALDRGESPAAAAKAAAEAAKAGAEATIPLQARKGRASYLGERSIGHQDPGATSAMILLEALSTTISRTA